jgi:glucose/arabinose dehydrogenase
VAVAVGLAGCGDSTHEAVLTEGSGGVRLVEVATGLDSPMQTVAPPGDVGELLILEQSGRVRLVRDGALRQKPVLDISGRVRSGGEQGLLSLALHPDFARNGLLYLHLSDPDGDTRIEEHRFAGGAIDPDPTRVLLEVDQPYPNHNGGSLAFGPDGKLYLGLGDGGGAFDPEGNSQNLASRLGKLLRLAVDTPGATWETAAYGLRNPWRFAFDPATGDAWIGDVGQDDQEEVDVLPAGSRMLNFGWDVYEGRDLADRGNLADLVDVGALTAPVATYSHEGGCSITGGVVVRNAKLGALDNRYVFGDYCEGTLWSIDVDDDVRTPRRESLAVPQVVSFDAGPDGVVYVTSQAGTVFRVEAA